jgi:hypothetical protein
MDWPPILCFAVALANGMRTKFSLMIVYGLGHQPQYGSHFPATREKKVPGLVRFLKFILCPPSTLHNHSLPTMGTGKKEANRKIRQGKVGDGMANVKTKGENFYRYVT